MRARIGLPTSPRLASRETRVARRLLLGGDSHLPLGRRSLLTDSLGGGVSLGRQDLGLAGGSRGETFRHSFGGPYLSRDDDRLPGGLAGENGRIIGGRARPEPGQRRLPRFGCRIETIDELVALERIYGLSRRGPGFASGTKMVRKPLPDGNGVTARHKRTREAQAA